MLQIATCSLLTCISLMRNPYACMCSLTWWTAQSKECCFRP